MKYVIMSLLALFATSVNAYEIRYSKEDIECLTQNIYFEARNQSDTGQIAVAFVTMNRLRDYRYPATICDVVKQGPVRESWKTRGKEVPDSERKFVPIRHKCHFSWYCDGQADIIYDKMAYQIAKFIAIEVVTGGITKDPTLGATHYHATYVDPFWVPEVERTTRIGAHIFYRWPVR